MNFHSFSRKYIFFFFLLGQSPFYSRNSSAGKQSKKVSWISHFIVYIPSLLYSTYLVVVIFIYFHKTLNEQLTISFSLYTLFISNKIATSIVVLKGSPFVPNTFPKIWSTFKSLEQYSIQNVQFQWSYAQHERNLLTKFGILLTLNICRISSKFLFDNHGSFLRNFMNFSMIVVAFTVALHILFYLEMMSFAMKTVNEHLSKSLLNSKIGNGNGGVFMLQDNHERKLYADVEVYKWIHFKLFRLCKLINTNFGWIFECYFMQVFGNMLNLFTVIVIEIDEENLTHGYYIICMLQNNFNKNELDKSFDFHCKLVEIEFSLY